MTSLFFVMLVLFVVTIGYLQHEKKVTEEQLEKVKEIQASTKQLPTDYFSYQPQYKRFKLNRAIQFAAYDSVIRKDEDRRYLKEVGNSLLNRIDSLSQNPAFEDFDIKYLVIIEGMASKDNYAGNFQLSYARALSLYNFWKSIGIVFDPEICEIHIAGSGTEGLREFSGSNESKNQQFLIHIVPKIGEITERNE